MMRETTNWCEPRVVPKPASTQDHSLAARRFTSIPDSASANRELLADLVQSLVEASRIALRPTTISCRMPRSRPSKHGVLARARLVLERNPAPVNERSSNVTGQPSHSIVSVRADRRATGCADGAAVVGQSGGMLCIRQHRPQVKPPVSRLGSLPCLVHPRWALSAPLMLRTCSNSPPTRSLR